MTGFQPVQRYPIQDFVADAVAGVVAVGVASEVAFVGYYVGCMMDLHHHYDLPQRSFLAQQRSKLGLAVVASAAATDSCLVGSKTLDVLQPTSVLLP